MKKLKSKKKKKKQSYSVSIRFKPNSAVNGGVVIVTFHKQNEKKVDEGSTSLVKLDNMRNFVQILENSFCRFTIPAWHNEE